MASPHSSKPTGQTSRKTELSWSAKALLAPIFFYRYAISPLIGPRCRFYPTCSTYAVEAIQQHGAVKGGCLTLKRLAKCHPFHEGGEDPVPPKAEKSSCKG